MASVFRTSRNTEGRSGGKIARGGRTAASATPYDRPTTARAPPESPNWFTGVIFPTSRIIATGATKVLSSIFGQESSSSSSSSGSDSEDDIDDKNANYHTTFDGDDGLNKNGQTPELINSFWKEPQLAVAKSETKLVIEKLLVHETFTREERDRLVEIINSRVIEGSVIEEGQDERLGIPDLCSKAIAEARQWLEEKKVGTSSKSDFDYGTCTLNSTVVSQGTTGELGSPLDMARSYMLARPPWASPSINYMESRSPSPMGRKFLKEETPYSLAGNSFSSSKKMCSLSSGSWNIQEEIRKVRSKATEDMLKTSPSGKINLSKFALEPKSMEQSLLSYKTKLGEGVKHDLSLLPATQSIDASLELAAELNTLSASVFEIMQEGSQNKDLTLQSDAFNSAKYEDLEAIQTGQGKEHAASSHSTIRALNLDHDSRLSDAKEDNEQRRDNPNANANGFPFSGSSLSAGYTEQNPRPSEDKNPKPVGSSHDNLPKSVPVEETCELLSEASVEVPVVDETNSVASGSPKSYNMDSEEISQEPTHRNPEHGLTGKTADMVDQQPGRKRMRYSRKGRGKA